MTIWNTRKTQTIIYYTIERCAGAGAIIIRFDVCDSVNSIISSDLYVCLLEIVMHIVALNFHM